MTIVTKPHQSLLQVAHVIHFIVHKHAVASVLHLALTAHTIRENAQDPVYLHRLFLSNSHFVKFSEVAKIWNVNIMSRVYCLF